MRFVVGIVKRVIAWLQEPVEMSSPGVGMSTDTDPESVHRRQSNSTFLGGPW